MKLLKKWLLIKLCFLLAMPFNVWSQAQPVAQPDRVGRSLSGVLQDGMRTRGFAANDPRFGNTLVRVSPQLSGVAGTAAAVTVGAVTAPGWASLALAIGIGAVITYAVNLGIDSLVKWLFHDSTIDDFSSAQTAEFAGISFGGSYWSVGSPRGVVSGGDGIAVARQAFNITASFYGVDPSSNCSMIAVGQAKCLATKADAAGNFLQKVALYNSNGAPGSCLPGHFYLSGSGCALYLPVDPSQTDAKGLSPQAAIARVTASDLDKKLNPAITAAIANKAWQQAASQPGYDGLPYPQSNPITSTEVATWTAQNPAYEPTVQDFVAPNPVTTANPQPWALPQNPTAPTTTPATTPNANTTNPAATNPQQNLGADPAIGSPTLEDTPTASMILQPLLSLLPDLKNFSPTMATGTCPRPTLNLFGQTQTFEAHCTILDNNRTAIHAAMVLAFTLSALLIILSA